MKITLQEFYIFMATLESSLRVNDNGLIYPHALDTRRQTAIQLHNRMAKITVEIKDTESV